MINYYQPYLFSFLHTKPYHLPKKLKQLYYFSWEDGLWDLLNKKDIPKLSTILLPDFYCIDVVENIRSHGYTVVFYPLDHFFHIETQAFIKILKNEHPAVIILFHAAGITCSLIKDTSWHSYIDSHSIILEDCVQRLVNPESISLIHPHHIVMDSLRKDSPLRGSFLYGKTEFLTYKQSKQSIDSYILLASLYYFLFRLVLELSAFLHLPFLTKFAHEYLLKKHDDIIGDSFISHPGFPIIPFIHRYINFQKIETLKEKQTAYYESTLSNLFTVQTTHNKKYKKALHIDSTGQSTDGEFTVYRIPIPQSDYKHLHVYPLGIQASKEQQTRFLSYLHKKGIIVWIKFPDSPWSQHQQVVFLPLGFHISKKQIRFISDSITAFSIEEKYKKEAS